jgi:hypothetical protein
MTQIQDAPATRASGSPLAVEDVGNIVSLEHVNTCIDDQAIATTFYIVGMGFTRDPHINVGLENMWVNVGEQQFHLPTRSPQVLPGHIGIVVPDLQSLAGRLQLVQDPLSKTKFSFSVGADHVAVTSPWGNRFRCHEPNPRFGDMRLGIPYVEVQVRRGAAPGIVRFYQQVLGAPASLEQDGQGAAAQVRIGTYQWLTFRETDDEIPPYDNHHIAVYVANFSGPYEWLQERDLIKEGVRNHQFRFQEIVEPDTGEHLHTLEHEVRGLFHPMYRREMVNRNAEQDMRAYVRGHDALIPFGA